MSNSSQASQRIAALLDDNSFVEIGAKVTARATDFNMKPTETPSDGVVTGYGVIDGSLVYVYSQDASVMNGTVGEMHAKKIANLYDLALKTGAPVIGLIDSAGLRLQEATDALNAFGEIYMKQTLASGVIPQITAVFGNCGGGLALIPALTDFTFMEGKKAKLFVNSPNALAGNNADKCDTAAADFQSEKAGLVDVVADEADILAQIRQLVSMLPANNEDEAFEEESHYNGLLEYPQYTRPYEWHGKTVPDVLLTGHHANIMKWRREQSLERTKARRPDLLEKAELNGKDLKYLQSLDKERKK